LRLCGSELVIIQIQIRVGTRLRRPPFSRSEIRTARSSSRSDGIVSSSVEFTVDEPAGRAGHEEEVEEWTVDVSGDGLGQEWPRWASSCNHGTSWGAAGVSLRFGSALTTSSCSLLFPSTRGYRQVSLNEYLCSQLSPSRRRFRTRDHSNSQIYGTLPTPQLLVQWVVLDIHSATLAPVFEIAADIPHEAPLLWQSRTI